MRETPRVNCGVTRLTARVTWGSILATLGKAFAASGSNFDATSGSAAESLPQPLFALGFRHQ